MSQTNIQNFVPLKIAQELGKVSTSGIQVIVRGTHVNFVSGILNFGTYLKTCLWNPETYRHRETCRHEDFVDSFYAEQIDFPSSPRALKNTVLMKFPAPPAKL